MHVLIGAATDFGDELFGGISSYVLDVVDELARVATVTMVGIGGKGSPASGVSGRLIFRPVMPSISKRASLASAVLLNGAAIRRMGPNVQYAHNPELALVMSIANPHIPVVMHAHGTESTLRSSRFRLARSSVATALFRSLIERRAHARVAAIIVTSDASRYSAYTREMSPDVRAKCVRIPSMVKVERYLRPQDRASDGQKIRLIAIGRLVPGKGVHTALQALALLHRRGINAELKVLGDGPERRKLERLATELGLGGAVDFAGYVPRESIAGHLWDADVCISGSLQEGFSMALLESLASGVPVVGFDVGGIADVVEPRVSGVVAQGRSPESLAEAVRELLPVSDENRHECMRIASGYSSKRIADRIRSVLEAVAVGRKSREWPTGSREGVTVR